MVAATFSAPRVMLTIMSPWCRWTQRATTDVGVSSFDKAFCTINLYHLFRERGSLLEYIKLETSVDDKVVECKEYMPYDVVEKGHIVISPVCQLEKSRGSVRLKVTTNSRERNVSPLTHVAVGSLHADSLFMPTLWQTPADYHLVFRYIKDRGEPPVKLSRHEIRGVMVRQPISEDIVREEHRQPRVTDGKEGKLSASLLDRMRVSPPEEIAIRRRIEDAPWTISPKSTASLVDVHYENDPRQDCDDCSNALLPSPKSPLGNTRKANSRRSTPSMLPHDATAAALSQYGTPDCLHIMGTSTAGSSSQVHRHEALPDTDFPRSTRDATADSDHARPLTEAQEERDLRRQCDAEAARAATLRRHRLLMEAKRRALEEELLVEEEEAKVRQLEKELSLKRKMCAR